MNTIRFESQMKTSHRIAAALLLALAVILVSCVPENKPTPGVSSTDAENPRRISTATPRPTITFTLPPAATFTSTAPPTLPPAQPTAPPTPTTLAGTVLMAYYDHENCTIRVNTQAWKISDYWKKNIVGGKSSKVKQQVFKSNNYLIYLVEHQMYPGCQVAWALAVGFEESNILQVSFETINGKTWKIWNINNNSIRVYFWEDFDIRFMQTAPRDAAQAQGCTEDVYQIIESLSCEQSAALPTPAPAPHQPESGAGKIAFISDADFKSNTIAVMNADGLDRHPLITDLVHVEGLQWSPDGKQIVFVAKVGDDKHYLRGEIYAINADGSGLTDLSNHQADDLYPAWSPDSKKIAFTSSRDGNDEIYVVNADGSGLANLTQNHQAQDSSPAWSPDGSKIVLGSVQEGVKNSIYWVNADGSNPTWLADTPGYFKHPAWSPDGSQLAYAAGVGESPMPHLFVINRDGSNPVDLTPKGLDGYLAFAWSPDGSRLVYASRDGEIYVINADGSNPLNLTQNPARDSQPDWSPDGSRIVFQSDRDGNNEIYVMSADGSNLLRLTNYPTWDISPAWMP